MSELRWILLAIGVVVVAAIYFLWGRDLGWRSRKDGGRTTDAVEERKEPGFVINNPNAAPVSSSDSQDAIWPLISETEAPAERRGAQPEDSSPLHSPDSSAPPRQDSRENDDKVEGPQKIIVLHVAGRGSVQFSGTEVVAALQAEGMQLGKYEIFHRLDSAESQTMFSAASMVEPGTFDLSNIDEIATPGISLFLVLPGPVDGAEAFSEMLITARNLAQRLGAEVLDEHGSSLSNQTAGHIREQILSFQLRVRSMEDVGA